MTLRTNPKHGAGTNPHAKPRFRLRTLLLGATGACVLLAVLVAVLPDSLPLAAKMAVFILYGLIIARLATLVYKSQTKPRTPPQDTVTVQVDAKWLRRVKSPIIMTPIAAMTGVSVSFAPLYLLWCGQLAEFGYSEWIGIPIALFVINVVPGFYMGLASEVIAQLLKTEEFQAQPAP